MKRRSKQQNYNKKEKQLLESTKFGVPDDEIAPYLEYLETKRQENQLKLSKAEEELRTAESLFLNARTEYENLKVKQRNYDVSFQHAAAFQANPKGRNFVFYSTQKQSPTLPPPQEDEKKRRELRWFDRAAEILAERKEFMEPSLLFKAILRANPYYQEAIKKSPMSIAATEKRVLANFERGCGLAGGLRKRGEQVLIQYKGKIGLYSWVDRSMVPLPQFMNQFMYGTSPQSGEIQVENV